MSTRPNILFLMSDEHRPDVTGYEGNDVVRTPTLDWLAETGVAFRNAYTPSPACVPARQCLMSGQLPKTCGCEGWMDLAPYYYTFARHFARYAYGTVVSGKLHHEGIDQMQGWTSRICGDMHVATKHFEDRIPEEFARYERPFGDYKWSNAKEVKRAGIGHGSYQINDEFSVLGAKNLITRRFVDPYYDREQLQQPMLMKVSLLQPHYPFLTDEDKFCYYLNRVQPYLDQQLPNHPFLSQRQVRQGEEVSPREIRRATAAYYGMVETVDMHFGQVLKALQDVGQDLDDWIIIYTSDHGDMLGQHSLWEKVKFYEASARVPLIIRWPKGFNGGHMVTENVNLCDLYATMCDLAGLPIPEGLDSRSLAPLLRGEPWTWENETISQYVKNVMIKRDALKYQYYGPEMPEVLFDLERDPAEEINYIDDPAYCERVASFRARLAELGHGPNADPHYVNAGYAMQTA